MSDTQTSTRQTSQPKILVLGATGGTGRLIVAQALARGHDVAVLVRSAEKAKDFQGVTVIVGDARDEQALGRAVKGRDAVVSALGSSVSPFREVTLFSTATKGLVAAMKAEGVHRLIAITGIGAGDSVGHGGFLYDRLIFPLLLEKVYADKNRQEALIRDSGLDWVLVRPAILSNKPGRGNVRALTDLSHFHGGSIARADVARFVLDQVEGDGWLRQAPLIVW